jgi:tetratricopeptide (TPR) repeat protein
MGSLADDNHRSSSTKSSNYRGVPGRGGRLRVAVLPLLANDRSEDDSLGCEISRALVAALRQFGWFDVISLDLSPNHLPDSRLIDGTIQTNALDYMVEGAVSRDGKRAQVSIRLLDLGECARTVWSERGSLRIAKLSEWSNLVAGRIVTGMDPVTCFFDGHPQRRKRSGASGLLLAAISLMASMERRKYEEAGRMIDRALDIEPDNALAAAWAAFWQVVYFGQGWTQNFVKASAIAQVRARRAIELSPDNAETLAICGHVSSFLGRDYDTALHYFDRSQRLDPGLEFSWLWSALTYCYAGKPGFALERLGQYGALTSVDPSHAWVLNIYSVAYVFAGNYEKAVTSARRGINNSPGFVNAYKPLIASLGHLGRPEEAKPYVDKLLALEPNFTVERFGQVYPIKYESDREHYMRGLRLAGVPER